MKVHQEGGVLHSEGMGKEKVGEIHCVDTNTDGMILWCRSLRGQGILSLAPTLHIVLIQVLIMLIA